MLKLTLLSAKSAKRSCKSKNSPVSVFSMPIVPFSITGKYTKNGKLTICFGEAYNLESDDLVLENERLMEKVTNLLLENGVDKNGKRKN